MLIEADQKIMDEFLCAERELETALRGLREEQLDMHAAPGEWSIRQIVHHVADDGDVWCFLMKRAFVLPGSTTVFGEFPGNEVWSTGLDTHQRSTRTALALIHAHRLYMADLLTHFADRWDNTVVIQDARGENAQPLSVRQMVDMLGEHLREHVTSILTIRAVNGLEKAETGFGVKIIPE
jgi:hypothetical protein